MTRYLISFDAHAMDHIAREELSDVGRDAHAVCQQMIDAGVLVATGGLVDRPSLVVSADGSAREGDLPDAVGGLAVVDVATVDEARLWAARLAAACRCDQEVHVLGDDPELDEMLRRAGR